MKIDSETTNAVFESQDGAPAAPPKRKGGRPWTRSRRDSVIGTLFALSPLVGFALFGLLPLLFSVVLSFGKLQSFDLTDIRFIGFDNYVRIFTEDRKFLQSIGNTFLYAIVSVFLSLVISLALAVLLNRKIKGKKIFRVILFIPYVCSVVAISMMWKWLFDYNYGILNDLMDLLSLPRVNWLNDRHTAMPIMILMSIWSGLGYNMILFTAALGNVNRTYYEAAELDGASRSAVFFKITLPLISPTTFFLLIMGFIGALQSFANFLVMTPSGGPDGSTWTMVLRVYYVGFVDSANVYGMGYASAMSWIVGVIVIIFTALNFYFSKRWVHYD